MKQRLLITLVSALIFGAGFAARVLTEGGPSVPPVSAMVGSEFSRSPLPHPADSAKGFARATGATKAGAVETPAVNRAKLVSEIARYHSEIETYRQKLEQIDADFVRELGAI